jgi:hypothetical protein
MKSILTGYTKADKLDMNDIKLIKGIFKNDPFECDQTAHSESPENDD